MTAEQLYDSFADIDSRYLTETMKATPKKTRSFWVKAACSAALILVLISCFSLFRQAQRGFYLSQQNGQFFLTTGQESDPNPNIPDNSHSEALITVVFDSVEEMRRDFLTCNFAEKECEDIVRLLRRNGGKVEAPDLLNLCKPVLPDNVTWTGKVTWCGSAKYKLELSCDTMYVDFTAYSKHDFEAEHEQFPKYEGADVFEVIEKTQVKDGNATLYRVQHKGNGHISCFLTYTLTDGDKTIYVREYFYDPDSELPSYIKIAIRDDDLYCSILIDDYETRPSVEWLLSFGLERCP